jgi:mannose-6-phosphate isomerase-like protein (cupin superfamily)
MKSQLKRIEITKKPWGEEHLFALTRKYAGKILRIMKGHRLSLQYHKKKDETLLLREGKMKLSIGRDRKKLKSKIVNEGCVFYFPRKTIHRMEALEDCLLIEVSTPELEDVVRLHDDYERK